MSYKIAVASSAGNSPEAAIDLSFGAARTFLIYQAEDGVWSFLEERKAPEEDPVQKAAGAVQGGACPKEASADCGGCGPAASGGCGGGGMGVPSPKVELLQDCRCVICRKIGFPIQKQLERRAITFFDINCPVREALDRIALYFKRIDRHQSLRGISQETVK